MNVLTSYRLATPSVYIFRTKNATVKRSDRKKQHTADTEKKPGVLVRLQYIYDPLNNDCMWVC